MSPIAAIFTLCLLGPAPGASPGGEPSPAAAPGDPRPLPERSAGSVGSLLSETRSPDGSPRAGDREVKTQGVLFQMLGWTAAIAVASIAAVRIWRKFASAGRLGLSGGGLRVVGRTALTPRHFLYAVRVGNQRLLVVGVSGDRISAITEFDDPAQVLALDPSFQATLERASGEGERPSGGNGGSLPPGDLSPYRSEINRLLEMVRGWRGRLGRTLGTEVKAGEEK